MREPRALVETALVLYRWHVVPPSPAHSWSHVLGQPIRDQRRGMTTLARQPQPGTPDVPPYRNSESNDRPGRVIRSQLPRPPQLGGSTESIRSGDGGDPKARPSSARPPARS